MGECMDGCMDDRWVDDHCQAQHENPTREGLGNILSALAMGRSVVNSDNGAKLCAV